MLYLITTGEYSSFGIVELLESALSEEEVTKLYKEYNKKRDDWHKLNRKEGEAWILSHPVLPHTAWYANEFPLLIRRAQKAWDEAHPERDADRVWLESQGVHEVAYTEIYDP